MDKRPNTGIAFAAFVSRLFDPMTLLPTLMLLSLTRSGLAAGEIVRHMGVLVSVMVVPPALLLLWAVKTGRVSNWDMSKREERVRALSVFSVFLLADYALILWLGPPQLIRLFGAMGIVFIGFFLITLKFKLSGHMSTLVFFLVSCSIWYGAIVYPLFFLLPLIGWSRLVLKRHTLAQVLVGTGYGLAISLLCASFGLIS